MSVQTLEPVTKPPKQTLKPVTREQRAESIFADLTFPPLSPSDVLAGVSVALVLIPQCLAYATIAGMPPHVGLFASAIPLLVFALFASSPYLQTGPVAMTSLLTLACLSSAGFTKETTEFVAAGALLALMVGVIRLVFGMRRLGWVAYLISDPVMIGFTSGAAIIIMASQFPKCVGLSRLVPDDGGTISNAIWALTRPEQWSGSAIALSLLTMFLMVGGRQLHRLFPGVLVAVVIGIVATMTLGEVGPIVDKIPVGFPEFSLALPWAEIPSLTFGALVIAFVGFAEPSAIARFFASEDNTKWNPDREFFSSGLANVASAVFGGFPVGGSFSRSSVNRVSGAKTRWSGAVTGVCVLAFLPFAWVLSSLPLAVLGGIVLAAVYRLTKPRRMVRLWWRSPIQAALAWTTFAATLIATPHIHWAVLSGVALSALLHFTRGLKVREVDSKLGEFVEGQVATTNEQVTLQPEGLLWFATQKSFREQLQQAAEKHSGKDVVVDLSNLIALDVTTIECVSGLAKQISPRRVGVYDSPWKSNDVVLAAIERETAA